VFSLSAHFSMQPKQNKWAQPFIEESSVKSGTSRQIQHDWSDLLFSGDEEDEEVSDFFDAVPHLGDGAALFLPADAGFLSVPLSVFSALLLVGPVFRLGGVDAAGAAAATAVLLLDAPREEAALVAAPTEEDGRPGCFLLAVRPHPADPPAGPDEACCGIPPVAMASEIRRVATSAACLAGGGAERSCGKIIR